MHLSIHRTKQHFQERREERAAGAEAFREFICQAVEWGRKDPANVSQKALASSFLLCFLVGKNEAF